VPSMPSTALMASRYQTNASCFKGLRVLRRGAPGYSMYKVLLPVVLVPLNNACTSIVYLPVRVIEELYQYRYVGSME
jgi:hypothetical protein